MKKLFIAALILAPVVLFAQTVPTVPTANLSTFQGLIQSVGVLVRTALPIVVGIGLLVFLWGLVKFIFAGTEEKEAGKSLMIWGLVALFLMVSVWGLVRFMGGVLGIGQGGSVTPPGVTGL